MLRSATRLVRLTSPDRPLDRELLHAAGGFAWWYLDAIDPQGNGVVVIWSFGLPFLPGYRAASRRGEAPSARERPSLNVAVYREGREAFYLLQEYPTHDASWDGEEWRFGDSVLRSEVRGGRRQASLSLDCPLPGTRDRLRGRIALDGVPRRPTASAQPTLDDHDWSPLTGPATVDASLRVGSRSILDFAGRGYHDRNGSRTPFDRLGIDHWVWGRVPMPDRELIYYVLWPEGGGAPEALALEIDDAGQTRDVPVRARLTGERRARYGMPYWARVELLDPDGGAWLDVRHGALLDDGPFYLRFGTEATRGGGRAHGTGELVRPGRVDLAPMRPFVKMRVHHTEAPTSRLNPLFLGPRRGRWRRQLGTLLG